LLVGGPSHRGHSSDLGCSFAVVELPPAGAVSRIRAIGVIATLACLALLLMIAIQDIHV
jgi:hypothetical protein